MLRHKARLGAELTKARIRRGHGTLEALREAVDDGALEEGGDASAKARRHPRWVRVNTLKTSLADQLSTTLKGYEEAKSLSDVQHASPSTKIYFVDPNIPNLLALPLNIDLSRSPAYANGAIIFQDKASCFPAYLLDVGTQDGDAIDGCAAPGNKTTHLAAMVAERQQPNKRKVIAFERDKTRAVTLQKMVKLASADSIVSIKAGADFLAAAPDSSEFANVGAILLDPSCSGSGIVGRDDAIKMHLPARPTAGGNVSAAAAKDRKRKRGDARDKTTSAGTTLSLALDDTAPEETPVEDQLSQRLVALSAFQLRILTHAMRFPSARKITYSTCSVHFEENEGVVLQALASPIAKERGWRILTREAQVRGLKKWDRRGVWEDGKIGAEMAGMAKDKEEICDACIRCEKGTEEGTMGFFVAAFVRDTDAVLVGATSSTNVDAEVEEEWNGFEDEEMKNETDAVQGALVSSKRSKKKRKKSRVQ